VALGLAATGAGAMVFGSAGAENGSTGWGLEDRAARADDVAGQVAGYASLTSVGAGDAVSFHVSTDPAQPLSIGVYRLGHHGGAGGRLMASSPTLRGARQPPPVADPHTGELRCDWPVAWTLEVPGRWPSGLYAAVFTTAAGWRAATPFVVRDDRRTGDLLAVLPFATYQAYNMWPMDGRTGRSLYNGYSDGGRLDFARRARTVSFDRPYADGNWPARFAQDRYFVQWAERVGLAVSYASNVDLHTGRVDPTRYAGLVFPGHDEYWSAVMRDRVTRALAGGTSLAFLGANNVYWRVRFADSRDGRSMVCAKVAAEDTGSGPDSPTVRWRDAPAGGVEAEQGLLGVQYNGIVRRSAPLVVRGSGHWLWAGSGVRDGDRIPHLVGGEADGVDPAMPRPPLAEQTLLSASPYPVRGGRQRIQNTSVYHTPGGAVVFVAGTLNWTYGLGRHGFQDARIQTATGNLLTRMLAH
jgi:hypothetical protein